MVRKPRQPANRAGRDAAAEHDAAATATTGRDTAGTTGRDTAGTTGRDTVATTGRHTAGAQAANRATTTVPRSRATDRDDICGVYRTDPAKIAPLREKIAPAAGVAEIFAALADPTRVKIAYALCQEDLCVCNLSALLGVSPQTCSYHLRLLRSLRIVRYRRQGRNVIYSVDDEHVRQLITMAVKHLSHR